MYFINLSHKCSNSALIYAVAAAYATRMCSDHLVFDFYFYKSHTKCSSIQFFAYHLVNQ